MEIPNRNPQGPLRIPILDIMKERGIMLFGKVESGTVEIGTKITIAPTFLPAQVLNIFNSKEELVRYAKPGENVKIRLSGIDDENLI